MLNRVDEAEGQRARRVVCQREQTSSGLAPGEKVAIAELFLRALLRQAAGIDDRRMVEDEVPRQALRQGKALPRIVAD